MFQTEIDDLDHITRYCKPSVIFHGLPSSDAFLLRDKETYLSVNWLEFYGNMRTHQAIECVQQVFLDKEFNIKSTGRFVVFRVGNLKEVISIHSHLPARVVHLPNKKDQSHCGVFGYTGNDSIDELIAMKISQIARNDHMHPGIKSNDSI